MATTIERPVALVTGAGSGIGRAIALDLVRTHAVIAVDRSAEGLAETATLAADEAGEIHTQVADVTDFENLRAAVSAGERALGRVAAVVACAGIEVHGTVADLKLDDWDRCLAVNLTGTMLTARASLASLVATRGSFTAIASDAATQGSQGFAAYTASKHGVLGIVRSMAMDFAPSGVRSNAVCPGFVETPMSDRIFADVGEGDTDFYRSTVPLGRFALPGEVAFAVRHLVDSTYANGVVYSLDGGTTAGYFVPPARA